MEIKEEIFVEFQVDKKSKYIGEIKEVTPNSAYIIFPQAPHLNNYYDKEIISNNCAIIEEIPHYKKNIRTMKKQLRELFTRKYTECINYLNNDEFRQKNYLAMQNFIDNTKSVVEEILSIQREQEIQRAKEIYSTKISTSKNVGNYLLEYIEDRILTLEEASVRNRNSEAFTPDDIENKEKEFIKLSNQKEELNFFKTGIAELQNALNPTPRPRGRPKKKNKETAE